MKVENINLAVVTLLMRQPYRHDRYIFKDSNSLSLKSIYFDRSLNLIK